LAIIATNNTDNEFVILGCHMIVVMIKLMCIPPSIVVYEQQQQQEQQDHDDPMNKEPFGI